jgi:alkylation response protein AidB-like acyl-CoA dehydrogenase
MSMDLEYDDVARDLAESVRRFVARHRDAVDRLGGDLSHELWRGLADLGVLGLALEEGGALLTAAAMEALGAAGFPGPLVATFTVSRLLGVERSRAIVAGEALVSFGSPPLMPWAPIANVFVELDENGSWLAELVGHIEPVETLAGEPWGRCALARVTSLGEPGQALALGDVALAAYLVGAGEQLLTTATSYAAERVQFGRAIGGFQAVSHPLADCAMQLAAAMVIARVAAYELDCGQSSAREQAAIARLSATRAAMTTAYRAHQTVGALGFTVEGPIGRLAHRIRQSSLLAPGPGAARREVLAGLAI